MNYAAVGYGPTMTIRTRSSFPRFTLFSISTIDEEDFLISAYRAVAQLDLLDALFLESGRPVGVWRSVLVVTYSGWH